MKFSFFVATLLSLTMTAVNANVHLRVHILTELAGAGELCESPSKAKKCGDGLFCQKEDSDNGYCRKKSPGVGEQCGGKGEFGPWAFPCNASDLKCVLKSGTYSVCEKKSE